MGRYIDWNPVVGGDYSQGLAALSGGIDTMNARKAEERARLEREKAASEAKARQDADRAIADARQKEQMMHDRAREATSDQYAAMRENRDSRAFARAGAAEGGATVTEAQKAYMAGDTPLAQALVKSRRYVDPVTGEAVGPDWEHKEGGAMPTFAPAKLQEPEIARAGNNLGGMFAGKLRPPGTPDEISAPAQGIASMLKLQPQNEPPKPSDQEAEARAGAPVSAAIGDYQSGVQGAGRDRIVLPGGESIDMDRNARDTLKKQRMGEQADAWLNNIAEKVAGDEIKSEAAKTTAEAIRSGMRMDQAGAYYLSTIRDLQTQGWKGGESEKDRASREKIAAMRGHGKGAGVGGPSAPGLSLKENKDAEHIVANVIRQTGASKASADAWGIEKTASSLRQGGSALDRIAQGQFTRLGTISGAISDYERKFFGEIGGTVEAAKAQLLQWAADGRIPEGRRDSIIAAMDHLRGQNRQQMAADENTMRQAFETSPYMKFRDPKISEWAASRIRNMYVPPEARGAGGGKKEQAGMSPEDQATTDWAQKNPTNPTAAAWLKAHGIKAGP